MRRDPQQQRRAILIALTALLAADAALAFYSWKLASPAQAQQELKELARSRDLLRADVKRAQDIREKIPAIQQECDAFEQSFFPERSGYSSVDAELGSLAAKSGLQLQSTNFHPEPVKDRHMSRVGMQTVVSGRYEAVVRFLNGLQRSKNVYVIEGLTAAPEQSPGAKDLVRVTISMTTYFRDA